ncbi:MULTISPECIES: LacI family DNA-binding transcriptional regulator [Microbacterium]|uniref:LacI family DNA-binding transcriptional regulator n=1 Tax=Microbacterium TaxID=33882 RepID=UPI00217F034F|nr:MULTISPECIES: LacI family DNA-binding transcriptional regulator [Microbacterium]UWF77635.1 LacI family DNA-binding transcriptional regulator [Microbacterium neungamense]WCM55805.1 LacI family DNA-binding transcriptional regulator [Microbacterium sp. EF45047]
MAANAGSEDGRRPGNGDRRGATVADVARRAGVSKATAARALGDYGAVSAKVRQRVQDAAAELGYRPNEVARSMSTGRSNTIGIIVGDIENPAFSQATRGAADVAEAAGYDLILSNSREDVEAELKAIEVQLAKRVDGLIIAPASSLRAANYEGIVDAGRPVVFFDRLVHGFDADAVVAANRDGAARLTQVLLDAGHRRIAYVSTLVEPDPIAPRAVWQDDGLTFRPSLVSSVIDDRVRGYASALRAAGVPDPLALVRLGAGVDGIGRMVTELITGPSAVTAIIASDSVIAIEAFRAIRELGLRIPDDVSLVGFDNAPWTSVTDPGITVIAQPERELGAMATRLLIERIEGSDAPASVHTLPQELIPRGSVAAPRA